MNPWSFKVGWLWILQGAVYAKFDCFTDILFCVSDDESAMQIAIKWMEVPATLIQAPHYKLALLMKAENKMDMK